VKLHPRGSSSANTSSGSHALLGIQTPILVGIGGLILLAAELAEEPPDAAATAVPS
jgi:hypothetical protein